MARSGPRWLGTCESARALHSVAVSLPSAWYTSLAPQAVFASTLPDSPWEGQALLPPAHESVAGPTLMSRTQSHDNAHTKGHKQVILKNQGKGTKPLQQGEGWAEEWRVSVSQGL